MIKDKIKAGYPVLFRTNLYHRMVKLIKKEPGNSRSFALLRLRSMEINEDYQLNGASRITFNVRKAKQTVVVDLTIYESFIGKNVKGNCYKNDLILFTWGGNDKPPTVTRKDSSWIYPDEKHNEECNAVFVFPCPAGSRHWLLALRQKVGINGKEDAEEVYTIRAEGAQFIGSGSFNKKEQLLLDKRYEEIKKEDPYNFRDNAATLVVSETVETIKKKTDPNAPARSRSMRF